MHKISALLLSLLFISFTGCENKSHDDTSIPIEDTTEVFIESQDNTENQNIPELVTGTNTFILLNTKSKSHQVTVSDDQVIFHRNSKPIVLINVFATWCTPCTGQMAYLNTLQKKYRKDLFLAGILTHDKIDAASLKSFIAKHEINYFISNSPHNDAFCGLLANNLYLPQDYPIPLTVMYVEGKYFTHYEGSVPVEMIEYDIQQAQKQLKLKSNQD